MFLLLPACSPKVEFRDCTKGLADVDLVLDRGEAELGSYVGDIGRRLRIQCVPREEIGDIQNCWVPEEQVPVTDGCTRQLGSPLHDTLPDPPLQAVVVVAQDRSAARVLAHEVAAHWKKDGLGCYNHSAKCWDKAMEARIKEGIR